MGNALDIVAYACPINTKYQLNGDDHGMQTTNWSLD